MVIKQDAKRFGMGEWKGKFSADIFEIPYTEPHRFPQFHRDTIFQLHTWKRDKSRLVRWSERGNYGHVSGYGFTNEIYQFEAKLKAFSAIGQGDSLDIINLGKGLPIALCFATNPVLRLSDL